MAYNYTEETYAEDTYEEAAEQKPKKSHRGLINFIYIALTAILILLYIFPYPQNNIFQGMEDIFSSVGSIGDSNTKSNMFEYQFNSASKECQITGFKRIDEGTLTIPYVIDGYEVTSIGDSAFRGNGDIVNVTVPGSVNVIGNRAFADCASIKSITIEYDVSMIGASAFENCYSLSMINIPSTVTYLGRDAFNGCPYLSNIYFGGTMEQWSELAAGTGINTYSTCIVFCADGTIMS